MMGEKHMSACIPRKMKTLKEALGCEGSPVFGSHNWNSNCGFAINLPWHLQQYFPESLSSSHYVLDNTVVLGTYWLMHVSCYHLCKRDFATCEQYEMENSEWMFSLVVEGGRYLGKTRVFELYLLLHQVGLPGRTVIGKGMRRRMLALLKCGGGWRGMQDATGSQWSWECR